MVAATDDASFVTGIELRVDGGLMLERKMNGPAIAKIYQAAYEKRKPNSRSNN